MRHTTSAPVLLLLLLATTICYSLAVPIQQDTVFVQTREVLVHQALQDKDATLEHSGREGIEIDGSGAWVAASAGLTEKGQKVHIGDKGVKAAGKDKWATHWNLPWARRGGGRQAVHERGSTGHGEIKSQRSSKGQRSNKSQRLSKRQRPDEGQKSDKSKRPGKGQTLGKSKGWGKGRTSDKGDGPEANAFLKGNTAASPARKWTGLGELGGAQPAHGRSLWWDYYPSPPSNEDKKKKKCDLCPANYHFHMGKYGMSESTISRAFTSLGFVVSDALFAPYRSQNRERQAMAVGEGAVLGGNGGRRNRSRMLRQVSVVRREAWGYTNPSPSWPAHHSHPCSSHDQDRDLREGTAGSDAVVHRNAAYKGEKGVGKNGAVVERQLWWNWHPPSPKGGHHHKPCHPPPPRPRRPVRPPSCPVKPQRILAWEAICALVHAGYTRTAYYLARSRALLKIEVQGTFLAPMNKAYEPSRLPKFWRNYFRTHRRGGMLSRRLMEFQTLTKFRSYSHLRKDAPAYYKTLLPGKFMRSALYEDSRHHLIEFTAVPNLQRRKAFIVTKDLFCNKLVIIQGTSGLLIPWRKKKPKPPPAHHHPPPPRKHHHHPPPPTPSPPPPSGIGPAAESPTPVPGPYGFLPTESPPPPSSPGEFPAPAPSAAPEPFGAAPSGLGTPPLTTPAAPSPSLAFPSPEGAPSPSNSPSTELPPSAPSPSAPSPSNSPSTELPPSASPPSAPSPGAPSPSPSSLAETPGFSPGPNAFPGPESSGTVPSGPTPSSSAAALLM